MNRVIWLIPVIPKIDVIVAVVTLAVAGLVADNHAMLS